MRYLPSGDPVTTFSAAADRVWNDREGVKQTETTWYRVTVFNKQAEPCNNFLHTGSKVYVEGRLSVDPKTGGPKIFTRRDGAPGASFELISEHVEFLNTKAEDDAYRSKPAATNGNGSEADGQDF